MICVTLECLCYRVAINKKWNDQHYIKQTELTPYQLEKLHQLSENLRHSSKTFHQMNGVLLVTDGKFKDRARQASQIYAENSYCIGNLIQLQRMLMEYPFEGSEEEFALLFSNFVCKEQFHEQTVKSWLLHLPRNKRSEFLSEHAISYTVFSFRTRKIMFHFASNNVHMFHLPAHERLQTEYLVAIFLCICDDYLALPTTAHPKIKRIVAMLKYLPFELQMKILTKDKFMTMKNADYAFIWALQLDYLIWNRSRS